MTCGLDFETNSLSGHKITDIEEYLTMILMIFTYKKRRNRVIGVGNLLIDDKYG